MIQAILLIIAGICLYFGARYFGKLATLIYWVVIICAGFAAGVYQQNFILVGMAVLSLLFLHDDWENFKKD